MAFEIRKYEQQTQRSGEGVSAPASPSAFMAPARELASVGQTLAQVGERMTKAQAYQEASNALNIAQQKTNELLVQAESDPDPNNTQKYIDRLASIRAEAGKGLTLRDSQDSFDVDFNTLSNTATMKLKQGQRLKINDAGIATTLQGLELDKQAYLDASNHIDEFQAVARARSRIDNAHALGFIDAEKQFIMKEKLNKEIAVDKVNNDSRRAASSADVRAIKQDLRNGIYEQNGVSIESKTKNELLNSLDRKEKQIIAKENYVTRMNRMKATHEVMDLATVGLLEGPYLEEKFKTGQISNTTYNQLSDNINSPVGPMSNTEAQTYYNIQKYLLSNNVDEEKAIGMLLDANSSGKLSQEDMAKLYRMHLTPDDNGTFKSLEDAINAEDSDQFTKLKATVDARFAALEEKKKWWKPAIDMFEKFYQGAFKERQITDASQRLITAINQNKIQNKDIPAEARKVMGQDVVKRFPEIATYPKEGVVRIDGRGNKARVYPDGTYEEVK